MPESHMPSGIPEGPVILVGEPNDIQMQTARQSPQGRMYGVMVIPDELEVERLKHASFKDSQKRREMLDEYQASHADEPHPEPTWAERQAVFTAALAEAETREADEERTYNDDETAMAEEPIEHRLRRAWLNGFKEGVERAAHSIEDWGRWDS